MTQWSPKSKNRLVLLLTLFLALAAYGEDTEEVDYDETTEEPLPESTTTAPPRQPLNNTEITRELDESRAARDALNQTLAGMKVQLQRILNSVQSPPSVPVPVPVLFRANNNSNNNDVQANTELIQKLEVEINALKNRTELGPGLLKNEEAASPVVLPTLLQTELSGLRERIKAMTTQNEENAQLLFGNSVKLSNLSDAVQGVLEVEKGKKRQELVNDILQAFSSSQNELVKSLLQNLPRRRLLDSAAMQEIVRGMFAGNIHNYPKIIDLFKSAKRGAYKSGLTAIIHLFYNSSTTDGKVGSLTLDSSSNSSALSLVDEPNYLKLAYLAKKDFGTEFQLKFPQIIQNVVFKPKVCIRCLSTNMYLFVNRSEAELDGGYGVTTKTKKKSSGFCDWEILSLSESTSFIIRQRDSEPGGPFSNLNVLDGAVALGSKNRNPHYLWKIQLRKKAQELTLQSIPGSLDKPSYFLCSVSGSNTTERAVELRSDGEATACSWSIDG